MQIVYKSLSIRFLSVKYCLDSSPSSIKMILGLTWDWEICDNVMAGEMYCKAFLYLADGCSLWWIPLQT